MSKECILGEQHSGGTRYPIYSLDSKLPPPDTKKILPIHRIQQKYDYDCWVTCMQMLLTYNNINMTQDDIIDLLNIYTGATNAQVGYGLDQIFCDNNKKMLSVCNGDISFEEIMKIIDGGQPIIASLWHRHESGGHDVLIIGYGVDVDGVKQVYINDPSRHRRVYSVTCRSLSYDHLVSKEKNVDDWDFGEYFDYRIFGSIYMVNNNL
jgi:hypothetical protein